MMFLKSKYNERQMRRKFHSIEKSDVTPTKPNGTINSYTLATTITFHDLLNHH